ncbi:MAG: PAS domain S-box protein [Gammaproteobacteria bacterium]|nr:PAS domain S-box protein [Gammaproteobacteria bacterium]
MSLVNDFLLKNPALMSSSLEATPEGIVITDRLGVILWVNPAYEKMTGYELAEVEGKTPRVLKSGKQDVGFYKNLWDTIIKGDIWSGNLWNKRKDGSIYIEEQTITPVSAGDGEITHYIAIKRDITQQHELQKHFQRAQKIEAIGQLTGSIAHNFNNKLATILGYAELGKEWCEQSGNSELKDYLDEIYMAGSAASDLVKQMVAFSQNSAESHQLVQLPAIIKESLKVLTSVLPSSVRIQLDMPDNTKQVRVDPVHIHQMLIILITNACDAMNEKGHIELGVRLYTAEDAFCASCESRIVGDFVELYVRDTGKGITQYDRQRIFMPFYTTDEMSGKTGMGLSALHGVLHEQGGHIIVESVAGEYSLFRLLFPVASPEAEGEVEAEVSSQVVDPIYQSEARILVVDDEVALAEFIAEVLGHHGYRVHLEYDSKSALNHFSHHIDDYDLLIADQDMPYMTGIELAQEVLALRGNIPVILMTGYSDKQYEGVQGIDSVLYKPFQSSDLLKNIDKLV